MKNAGGIPAATLDALELLEPGSPQTGQNKRRGLLAASAADAVGEQPLLLQEAGRVERKFSRFARKLQVRTGLRLGRLVLRRVRAHFSSFLRLGSGRGRYLLGFVPRRQYCG